MKIKANELKKRIDLLGYSQQEFAEKCGISRQALSSWLNDDRNAKASNIKKIVDYLKCPMSDIAEIDDPTGNSFIKDFTVHKIVDGKNRGRNGTPPSPLPPFPSTPDTIRNTPELRECIKDAMLREGVRNASELNRRIGYDSANSIERLLAGKLNWFPDVLSAVLDGLNIKHDDAPMTPAERGLLAPDGMYNTSGVLTRPIPVVDWANAATHIASLIGRDGSPVMRKWDPENTDVALAPVGVRRNTQAFRVHGVSMEPTIADGDILFCEEQYDLNSIPSGKIVIVRFSDDSEYAGTVVCKRLRRAGSILMLTSDNEKTGKDITVNSPGEIAWIGIVVRKSCEL